MREEEANQRACINKAFEKIECFDGSNPNRCWLWLEQIHTMMNNYDRDYHEELLLNSDGSVTKTIHGIDVDAIHEQIKDIVLCNHSNLKTPSQRLHDHNCINRSLTKHCRLITVDMSHIFIWHIQTSQSMMLAQEHSASTTLAGYMAN